MKWEIQKEASITDDTGGGENAVSGNNVLSY
jgi:hypothetical protein